MNISDEQLRDLAGERIFQRGISYAHQGRVVIDSSTESELEATVAGTDHYRVTISTDDDGLQFECTCPAAEDGSCCKHVVAAVLAARDGGAAPSVVKSARDEKDANLRSFLESQPAERLADWLMECADTDPAIRKRLQLLQAQSDPKSLKKALSSVLRTREFFDWRASGAFARSLDPVLSALASAAAIDPREGHALYEYALKRLLTLYERSDDSSGSIGGRIHEFVAGYRRCLEQLPGDDAERGKRFLDLQRLDQWSFLELPEFWPLLRDRGQHAYATAVESEFAALPKPTQDTPVRERWGREFPVIYRMEQLATLRGDVDLLIGVLARDLSSGHAYERIVEVCRGAGRSREAMQWAERGYRHHPKRRGMRVLLAEEYERAGLGEEALALLWEDFREHSEVEAWRRLKRAAGDAWPDYREQALAHVAAIEPRAEDGRRDVGPRVTLLLDDGDLDAACALAETHAVNVHVLEALANAVASERPSIAAAFYMRVVEHMLPQLNTRYYGNAVELIDKAVSLRPGENTAAWVVSLRERYRARRKFIALLDAIKVRREQGRMP